MKQLFQKLRKKGRSEEPFVTIVSGLPRSGTSLMMKMLQAGGIPPLVDHIRQADEDNPQGYYEFERVKQLTKGDNAWVAEAKGKVVKVISALLEHLPTEHRYKVIFMDRRIDEILASQRKMLIRRGESPDKTADEKMAELYRKHLNKVTTWLGQQQNMSVIKVSYNRILQDPTPQVRTLCQFLDTELNPKAMAGVVDPNLYRNRAR